MTFQPMPGVPDTAGGWRSDTATGFAPPSSTSRHVHDGRDLAPGSVLAATLASEAWTAYTPTLTATTTNPTLGTGNFVAGGFARIGRTITGYAQILWGTAATNAGAGIYLLGLPSVAVDSSNAGIGKVIGSGYIFHSATTDLRSVVLTKAGGNTFMWAQAFAAAALQVGAAIPWVWGASDQITLDFTYEATS